MKRLLLLTTLVLFAGAREADAQSFLERLGQRAARAAEEALTRKAEEVVDKTIETVTNPETYKRDGSQGQEQQGQVLLPEHLPPPAQQEQVPPQEPQQPAEPAPGLDPMTGPRFVYPVAGEWKMSLVSCAGDRTTGTVDITIMTTRLVDDFSFTGSSATVYEARVTGTDAMLQLETVYSSKLHDFLMNKPVEVRFRQILGVPTDARTLDLKFFLITRGNDFELLDCPITWEPAEPGETTPEQEAPKEPEPPVEKPEPEPETPVEESKREPEQEPKQDPGGTSPGRKPETPAPVPPQPEPTSPDGPETPPPAEATVERPVPKSVGRVWTMEDYRRMRELEADEDDRLARIRETEYREDALAGRADDIAREKSAYDRWLRNLLQGKTPEEQREILAEIAKEKEIGDRERIKDSGFKLADEVWLDVERPVEGLSEDIVIDISHTMAGLGTSAVEPDVWVPPVLLDEVMAHESHLRRLASQDILASVRHFEIRELVEGVNMPMETLGRHVSWGGKPCREIILEVPLFHAKPDILPVRMCSTSPGFEGTLLLEPPVYVYPYDPEFVYIAVRIFREEDGIFGYTHIQHVLRPLEYEKIDPQNSDMVKFLPPDHQWPKYPATMDLEIEYLRKLPAGVDFISEAVLFEDSDGDAFPIPKLPLREGDEPLKSGERWYVRYSLAYDQNILAEEYDKGRILPVQIFGPGTVMTGPVKFGLPNNVSAHYEGNRTPLDELWIKYGWNEAAYFRIEVARKKDRNEDADAFDSIREVVPRYVLRSQIDHETLYDEWRVMEAYGLITFSATGKFRGWNSDGSTDPKDEYWQISLTGLGEKYVIPEERYREFMIYDSPLEQLYPPWVESDRPDWGSQEFRDHMNHVADERERLGRYYKDGESLNIGVLDCIAIPRDIRSGVLK
jgi:hypothetical protein